MNLLRIKDLGNEYIQVGWHSGRDLPRETRLIHFSDPLTAQNYKDLKWYLEESMKHPFNAEERFHRAKQIELQISEWGEALFNTIFNNRDTYLFYEKAVNNGLENCEFCISSDDPTFLNIPWEIIRDPTPGRGYLAPLMSGFYRQRTGHKTRKALETTQRIFRILWIISRPYGKQDIPYGTIARPMLEILRQLQPRIEIEILRPPTFDLLQNKLNTHRGDYQLVHFDGHGTFIPKHDRGFLIFENTNGDPDPIDSHRLGQVLSTSQVPLFILNACQSAEEGKTVLFSSIASQLLATGAKGVIAMSYRVHKTAASLFIKHLYYNLINHASLGEAVAAGRNQLYSMIIREFSFDSIELQDWMIPTLYLQESQYTPIPKDSIENDEEYSEKKYPKYYRKQVIEVCPQGRFGFIGRDYDILEIERRLYEDNCPWILLSGLGGIGKTELAFGFARWYAETGGCPGGVFVTSFKENTNFAQVIGSITGNDNDFSLLSEEHQIKELVKYLKKIPCLLIWDNFEVVTGYPKGTKSLMSKKDQEKLATFLQALRGGKSRVIIVTQNISEDWLRIAYFLWEVKGLIDQDVGQLVEAILRTIGKKQKQYKNNFAYIGLLNLFKGHPKLLQIIIPQLQKNTPEELLEKLKRKSNELTPS
ncbi:MAG: CHAT domain-containing protein [Candidatus Hodarchaeota archaeon]